MARSANVARALLLMSAGRFREGNVGSRQQGFSLIELTVAMTVTLIITGAMFQLLTAGKSAFRREPELSSRQQNIRMAIDLISQDVYRAGQGLPEFAQVFTRNLNGIGPMGSGGAASDVLELVVTSECGAASICDVNGTQLTTKQMLGACYAFPSMVILANEMEWHPMWADAPGGGANNSCGGGSGGAGSDGNGHVTFPAGQAAINPPGGPSSLFSSPPQYLLAGQLVRYRINPEADGTPNLERSAFGGQNWPTGGSSWEILARGVEDLQVEYENGAGWHNEPGAVSCGASCGAPGAAQFDTLVRRVRVRLSARATGGGALHGESNSAVGRAVRGQLVTEIAPRPATTALGIFRGDL